MNPLLIFKTVGISVGLGSGITGSIFSSFQAFTRISIEKFFGDDLFTASDSSSSDVWKILQKKLDDAQNQNEKVLTLSKLKDAKKPTSGNTTGHENGDKLKNWCSAIKNMKLKKFLTSNHETILLNYVRDFCILTIGEKLTSTNQFTSWETDNTTLKTNAKSLGSHQEGNNGKISGIKELEEIKTKDSNSDDNGKNLLKWCKSTYKKAYKNKDDNLWKLSEKYCKKSSPGV